MMIVFAPNHFGNGRSHRIHSLNDPPWYSSPRALALALALGYH